MFTCVITNLTLFNLAGGKIIYQPLNRLLSLQRMRILKTFDPSMSALPIIVSRIRQVLNCSSTNRKRELGLDRRETGVIGSDYVRLYHFHLKS